MKSVEWPSNWSIDLNKPVVFPALKLLYNPLSESLLWLFKGTLLRTCKWCILWKVTLGTNKLEPREQCTCETAGGAVEFLNDLFEFSCLTRPSVDIPFVFCSVSRRTVKPPERIITGRSAAHKGKPYSQNCWCQKTVTKESSCALRLLHSNYCSISSLLSGWPCRPDLSKPLHHSLITTWKDWLFYLLVFIQEHCNHF